MIYYYDNKRSISDWYIKLLRENIFTITIPGFFYQYSIMRFFLKRTFPFQSVKKGDNVLQVGSAAWTFDAGVSQTAMLSTLVGEKGNVIVFEPEKKNIEYHKKYCRRYGIKNIYVEPFGVWSDSGHLDFLIHQESDGGHVSEKIYHWRGGKDTNFKKTTIHVKTLSSYLDLKKIVPKLVNITVNAGEFNVLQGAEKSFKDIGNFTFPIFGPRKWYKDAIEMLIKSGYKVVLSDAPPTLRGRPVYRNQANKMCKNNPQRIVAFATKDISILPQKRLIPIEKLKRERQTYVFIQNHANTKNEKKLKDEVRIGSNVRNEAEFEGCNQIGDNSTLIGNVRIGYASTLGDSCVIRGNISIGRYCSLAERVSIFSKDHPIDHPAIHVGRLFLGGKMKAYQPDLPILIGHDVWMGCSSIVLKGVKIGNGAVIGAGSVVTRNIPNYSIAAGNPAKIIRERFPISIQALLNELRWWDLTNSQLDQFIDFFQTDLTENVERSKELIKNCIQRKAALLRK